MLWHKLKKCSHSLKDKLTEQSSAMLTVHFNSYWNLFQKMRCVRLKIASPQNVFRVTNKTNLEGVVDFKGTLLMN